MHAITCQALRSFPRSTQSVTCRFIGGRRFPSARSFQNTSCLRSATEEDPKDESVEQGDPTRNHSQDSTGAAQVVDDVYKPEEVTELGDINPINREHDSGRLHALGDRSTRAKDKSIYGSATRRASRNIRRGREGPRVKVPDWFLERNVTLWEERAGDSSKQHPPLVDHIPSRLHFQMSLKPIAKDLVNNGGIRSHDSSPKAESSEEGYEIDANVFKEISTMVAAGLRPSSTRFAAGYPASKPHLLLHCPKDGGIGFLDSVVNHVANEHRVDLIVVDSQDIAEIAGEYGEESPDIPTNSLRLLGYDTHLLTAPQEPKEEDEVDESDIYDEVDEEQDFPTQSPKRSSFVSNVKVAAPPTILFVGATDLASLFKSAKVIRKPSTPDSASSVSGTSSSAHASDTNENQDIKPHMVLEAFLDASQTKRRQRSQSGFSQDSVQYLSSARNASSLEEVNSATTGLFSPSSANTVESTSNALIILIRDYAEMNANRSGGALLHKLHEIVRLRRTNGQGILIIGTSSSEDLIPSMSKSGFNELQTEAAQGPYRTIITPCTSPSAASIFALDEKTRVKSINLRHLQDMLKRVSPKVSQIKALISLSEMKVDSAKAFASGLDQHVWSLDRVHRTASIAIGLLGGEEEVTSCHIGQALDLIDSSDNAKFDWLAQEKSDKRKFQGSVTATLPSDVQKSRENRLNKLRKTCNTHEKKLLNGVVDASNIQTTFADVQAADETIEALKTLTSLSLVRPEAFTYGVLATDKIPGLLLYGPPGTGKTMLAKAVAKESGATVLEVSGSDVYDMYVGEGEKNVKAIFTLAKKLTPCIVFIDEADAIFGSRGTSNNRSSHRELINQFLREWDGMNDLSAFIMVATNRPFDLDDAVLRRLPRRLLVDLPTEKDREAILKIHLKDEILDSSVSLSALASQTPFYSGSDLKNLSVAAALACIREENEFALAYHGSEPYKYPEKRRLTPKHFDKAMEEISASISEDMSSLSAIRKFDEKYGDRKGRRKRSSGYGFGTLSDLEKTHSDSVRVRAPI